MSTTRAPLLDVLADGESLPGILDAEVTSCADGSADRFSIRASLNAVPGSLSAWSTMTDSQVEIQVQSAGQSTSLITGQVDTISADPVGGTIRAEGRDLRAALLHAQTQESFANQTSSDIATLLAGRHGLAAAVTPTSTPVGRYYSADYTQVTLSRQSRVCTEWDLLLQLAELESFDVFVSGSALYFQPISQDALPAATLHTGWDDTGPPTVTALRLNRRMIIAGSITATVNSWNSQTQATVNESATRPADGSRPVTYLYSRPNLTADHAQAFAQAKLDAITRHECTIGATMPGEAAIFPRCMVAVTGTGSLFDASYSVDEVVRTISVRNGFTQTVRAHLPGGYGGGVL